MTLDHSQKDNPVFRIPNPTELKAAAVEDSILDRYPNDVDDDINEERPAAETVDVVDAKADDRPSAEDTHNSQTVKANLSGH
ncbi:MAG: hypothetical protein KME27_28825 [Lyngbya sp. HA4199-MV5]|nr:hypothetical protein [Lyngbya sp. HA4199-MV5]